MLPFHIRQTVREYAGGSVGGILRKTGNSTNNANASGQAGGAAATTAEARQVDLLVFGYACKVFRDDDKAREIDQGKHLIPWMGDNSLKIDRYDVRGALSDLAPYEPPPGGYGNRLDYLSAEEQRAEQLCEEERYLYLYKNEEEHILQQEEELKRLQQESGGGGGYSQVGFQYGESCTASDVQHGPNREDSPSGEDAEQAFALPRNFEVPASIQLPETMKQHAIIEKTARFIASQGVQMEILLKAKQSNNVQFEFLTQNSTLNPYYKYVMNAIKNGSYPTVSEEVAKEVNEQLTTATTSAADSNAANAMYASVAKPVITVPSIKYKPSANCAYTQLISKIKGVPLPAVLDENAATSLASSSSTGANSAANSPRPDTPNSGHFTPVLLQYNGNTFVTADGEDSNSNLQSKMTTHTVDDDAHPQVEILKNSSALALAQGYSSDSSEDEAAAADEVTNEKQPAEPAKPEPILNFPIPTESLRNIIDKTATYVIKNGRQFEETLRTKSEERFTFLLYDNEYYPYYMYKITGDPDAASKEQKTRKAAAVAAALLSRKGLNTDKTVSAPVSFSIKSKDEPTAAALQPALPQENSDDDEVDDEKRRNADAAHVRVVPEHVQKAIQLVESQLMARNAQLAAAVGVSAPPLVHNRATTTAALGTSTTSTRSRFDVTYSGTLSGNAKTQVKSTKAEMERNALYEQQQQNRQKELKKAEEKVKDKLAQIAREKLGGLISKEKQLQLERKRKAMAFLNQIKGTSPSSNDNASVSLAKKTKEEDDDNNVSDDSGASVHSIPITSYGPDEKTDDEEEPYMPPQLAKVRENSQPQQLKPKPTTVMLSDDDDVQLVSEIKPPPKSTQQYRTQISMHKRHSHSPKANRSAEKQRRRRRSRVDSITSSSSFDSSMSSDDDDYDKNDRVNRRRHHGASSKSRSTHKSAHRTKKSTSSTLSSKKRKKKSNKYSRSRSRSKQRVISKRERERERSSYRSRSSSQDSYVSTVSHNRRRHAKRTSKRSSYVTPPPTTASASSRRKEKKRKHER